jgi:cytochrome P450
MADEPVTIDLAASDDPRAVAKGFRENPVIRFDSLTLVTRRGDIEAALRNAAVFSSKAEAVNLGNTRPLIPLQIDPPKHVKYRRILDPLFAPRSMAALEAEVTELVVQLLDGFAEEGSCDLNEAFSVPLPCTVFLRLLGLPMSDLDQFLAMKEGIIRPDGDTPEAQARQRSATAASIYDYFAQTIESRRHQPTDDLLTRIMEAELDGEPLSDDEIADICFLFIIAGLDTVTDSLNCIFAHLAQHRDDQLQVRRDPSVIPSAIEELLRWESPVPAVARVATQDTEIAGCPIQAGEQVMLLIASANTDESAQRDLASVDLARNPNAHLAFGGGVHRCLGSHLARLELRVALREFHQRIGEYSLAPGTVLQYTAGLRSLHELPIVFTASERS